MADDIERIEHDADPERCESQHRQTQDQCSNKRMPGSKYCKVHGGNAAAQAESKKQHNNYRLIKFKSRVDEFASSPGIKNLREEIGIVRMILEETLNQCKDTNDLMIYSAKITGLVREITGLVNSTHKLESSLGVLLDKMAVQQLGQEIVEIISSELTNTLDAILVFVPEADHDAVRALMNQNIVDKIIERMVTSMEQAGEK